MSLLVQVFNPKICRWIKIDRFKGRILSVKKSAGPYKNIPYAALREDQK